MKNKSLLAFAAICIFAFGLQTAAAGLVNGSFEAPAFNSDGSPGVNTVDASVITGWSTTASDNQIEIWSNSFNGVTAYDGDQHAELNANVVGTLFQVVSGIAADDVVGFQFAHRGREGVDTMQFTLTDLGADGVLGGGDDTVLFTQLYSDDNTAWGFYTGGGIVALGNNVEFAFASISAAGGDPSVGNFLDDADFGVGVGGVPEPSTLLMLGTGIAMMVGFRRRKA